MTASDNTASGPSRTLTDELRSAAAVQAEALGVPANLHEDDFIFWFIHDQAHMTDKAVAVQDYFLSGRDGAVYVKGLLEEHPTRNLLQQGGKAGHKRSLLEFAAGYGRVTRHFRTALPDMEVVACDIHPQAVQFLKSLGVDAVTSTHGPAEFDLGRQFDVIYAFSFFTHMPRATWTPWLEALGRHLTPSGLLIFTTHGRPIQGAMGVSTLESDGFFFHPVSEQKDLDVAEYGNTVTLFDYVHRQAAKTKLRVLQFRESGAGQQDLYIMQRDLDASALAASVASRPGSPEQPDEAALLRAEIDALYKSRSWRVTSPLRSLSRTLTGRP